MLFLSVPLSEPTERPILLHQLLIFTTFQLLLGLWLTIDEMEGRESGVRKSRKFVLRDMDMFCLSRYVVHVSLVVLLVLVV